MDLVEALKEVKYADGDEEALFNVKHYLSLGSNA